MDCNNIDTLCYKYTINFQKRCGVKELPFTNILEELCSLYHHNLYILQ